MAESHSFVGRRRQVRILMWVFLSCAFRPFSGSHLIIFSVLIPFLTLCCGFLKILLIYTRAFLCSPSFDGTILKDFYYVTGKEDSDWNLGQEFIDLECRSSINYAMKTLLGMCLSGGPHPLLSSRSEDQRVGNCPVALAAKSVPVDWDWLDPETWGKLCRHFKHPVDLLSYHQKLVSVF